MLVCWCLPGKSYSFLVFPAKPHAALSSPCLHTHNIYLPLLSLPRAITHSVYPHGHSCLPPSTLTSSPPSVCPPRHSQAFRGVGGGGARPFLLSSSSIHWSSPLHSFLHVVSSFYNISYPLPSASPSVHLSIGILYLLKHPHPSSCHPIQLLKHPHPSPVTSSSPLTIHLSLILVSFSLPS